MSFSISLTSVFQYKQEYEEEAVYEEEDYYEEEEDGEFVEE